MIFLNTESSYYLCTHRKINIKRNLLSFFRVRVNSMLRFQFLGDVKSFMLPGMRDLRKIYPRKIINCTYVRAIFTATNYVYQVFDGVRE